MLKGKYEIKTCALEKLVVSRPTDEVGWNYEREAIKPHCLTWGLNWEKKLDMMPREPVELNGIKHSWWAGTAREMVHHQP